MSYAATHRIRKGSFFARKTAPLTWTYREDEAGLWPEHEARCIAHEVEGLHQRHAIAPGVPVEVEGGAV